MEIKVKTLLQEFVIATGLGLIAYLLGGNFGTVFVLYLVLKWLLKKE